jgi:hypothetical protein
MSLVVTLHDGLSLVLPGADGGDAGHAAVVGAGAPGTYPTARLQKGFLLFDGPRDLAEEGVGFGVPVLKCGILAVFAGGVDVEVREDGPVCTVRAVYRMGLVERLAGAGGQAVAPRPLYAAKEALAALHRRVPAARGLLTAISSALRRRFGWQTLYVEAGLKAEVPVISAIDRRDGSVRVDVDLSGLPADVTEVAVMNEQGARAFDRFEDAAGAVLDGDAIGTWDAVTGHGARFVSRASRVAFSVTPVDGASLRRGRELVGARLAWAGFGLTVPGGRGCLSYELRVGRIP